MAELISSTATDNGLLHNTMSDSETETEVSPIEQD